MPITLDNATKLQTKDASRSDNPDAFGLHPEWKILSGRQPGREQSIKATTEKDGERITAVHYSDGTSRQFLYDLDKTLMTIKQPDGTTWERIGATDRWVSQGKTFTSHVAITNDGTYSYSHWQGDNLVTTTIGTHWSKNTPLDLFIGDDLRDAYQRFAPRIDTNGDGTITRAELKAAEEISLKNGQAEDQSFRAFVKLLQSRYDDMKNLSHNQFPFLTTLTTKDIETTARMEQEAIQEERYWRQSISLLDRSSIQSSMYRSGKLTARGLEAAQHEQELSRADKETVKFLQKEAGSEGLTWEEIIQRKKDFLISDKYDLMKSNTSGYYRSVREEVGKEILPNKILIGIQTVTELPLAAMYGFFSISSPVTLATLAGIAGLAALEHTLSRSDAYKMVAKRRYEDWKREQVIFDHGRNY